MRIRVHAIWLSGFQITLRAMVDRAWQWAKQRNLWRQNTIHGEEEIYIVLDDSFAYSDEQGFESQQQGAFEMEDPSVQLSSSLAKGYL